MCNCFSKNLGLGEGSALPVGVPIPWPSATPPKGWLKCNGAAFTASQYPQLALAYPVMRLPDLRGEFLRGWDDGRGVDTGRALLSSQSHAFTDHRHALSLWTGSALSKSATEPQKYSPQASRGDGGSMDESVNTGGALGFSNLTNEVASSYKTYASNETRPRNIAFNYIVRAA
nr:phage tail protein [Enterobacter hormaechei]